MRVLSRIVLLAAALAVTAPVFAAPPERAAPAREMLAQQRCMSLGEAVERVRRQYRGRIVSAETRVSGNREVHVIKVLTEDGKVKTVQIPGCPRNG